MTDFPLFAPPKQPLSLTEYAIGLHVARLIADGGTLQIGIGEEGDAAVHAMILRHRDNAAFIEAVTRLTGAAPPLAIEERAPFAAGLYGVSEMLVDGFLQLIDAGILKRAVDGVLIHGGFFVGPKSLYRRLREMPPDDLARIQMTRISFTNQLYGDEAGKRAARVKARFVNNAMMATALGAVISDGLEDGRVVSGVGGQFNFVEQAFALRGARSIICINATRGLGARLQSNVRWNYGHTTIPRHMRDIVVSEYGIADLRGKSDEHVVAQMLSITDSRFQDDLLRRAREAGKIGANYEIPAAHRENHPARIAAALGPLRDSGLLPDYPFGCDFTPVEQRLLPALERLKAASPLQLARFALAGLSGAGRARSRLARMGLDNPRRASPRRFYRALVARRAEILTFCCKISRRRDAQDRTVHPSSCRASVRPLQRRKHWDETQLDFGRRSDRGAGCSPAPSRRTPPPRPPMSPPRSPIPAGPMRRPNSMTRVSLPQ